LRVLLGGSVKVAFIDGLHLFEQVLRDFVNLERHSDPDTVIVLHDCLPLDELTASRERTTDFFSGDVWKAVLALRRRRPDLEMVTVPAPPDGALPGAGTRQQQPAVRAGLSELIATYRDLDFDHYLAHRQEMPKRSRTTRMRSRTG
jgi:hypothetical protein